MARRTPTSTGRGRSAEVARAQESANQQIANAHARLMAEKRANQEALLRQTQISAAGYERAQVRNEQMEESRARFQANRGFQERQFDETKRRAQAGEEFRERQFEEDRRRALSGEEFRERRLSAEQEQLDLENRRRALMDEASLRDRGYQVAGAQGAPQDAPPQDVQGPPMQGPPMAPMQGPPSVLDQRRAQLEQQMGLGQAQFDAQRLETDPKTGLMTGESAYNQLERTDEFLQGQQSAQRAAQQAAAEERRRWEAEYGLDLAEHLRKVEQDNLKRIENSRKMQEAAALGEEEKVLELRDQNTKQIKPIFDAVKRMEEFSRMGGPASQRGAYKGARNLSQSEKASILEATAMMARQPEITGMTPEKAELIKQAVEDPFSVSDEQRKQVGQMMYRFGAVMTNSFIQQNQGYLPSGDVSDNIPVPYMIALHNEMDSIANGTRAIANYVAPSDPAKAQRILRRIAAAQLQSRGYLGFGTDPAADMQSVQAGIQMQGRSINDPQLQGGTQPQQPQPQQPQQQYPGQPAQSRTQLYGRNPPDQGQTGRIPLTGR